MTAATNDTPLGMPFQHSGYSPLGFTAVNGAIPSFRPAGPAKPSRSLSGKSSPGDNITVSTAHLHGWRDGVREVTSEYDTTKHTGDDTSTRKRSHPEDEDKRDSPNAESQESPKRRLLLNTLDSAVDLTSPDTGVERHHPGPGQSSRAASPVPNSNRPPPPPEVSSVTPTAEATKRLVESAKLFQQAQHAETLRNAAQLYGAEPRPLTHQAHGDPDPDSKPRQRVFANRTKTGCHTCRSRKKKCDETKPQCANCERGGFVCGGYGPKPPDQRTGGQRVAMPPLQPSAKQYTKQSPILPPAPGYWVPSEPARNYPPPPQPTVEPGRDYSHWGARATEPPAEPKRPSSRDSWSQNHWHHGHSQPPPQPLPPPPQQRQGVFYAAPPGPVMPILPPPDQLVHTPQQHMHLPPQPPPPHPGEAWQPYQTFTPHRYYAAPASVFGTNTTNSTSSSEQSRRPLTEKEKMLRGQLYLHCTDPQLILERERCVQALIRYNDAANPNAGIPPDQRAAFFTAILEPRKRIQADQKDNVGPLGEIGDRTIVDSPFKCDYGYHIHLGKDVVISSDCYLQDGGGIFVGDRAIIGSSVQLLTITASVDAKVRAGSQGRRKAGTIWIGDDVFIGAGVIVLPHVTIGKGAVVGAGSVVTRDVPENTVVAGNPAKHIRTIEGNQDRHHNRALDTQETNAVKCMEHYADMGWKVTTPRML